MFARNGIYCNHCKPYTAYYDTDGQTQGLLLRIAIAEDPMNIRLIAQTELAAAQAITEAAGLPIPSGTLTLYLTLQPDGCFVAVEHDQIIAMVVGICYDAFAFIGAMTVHPDYQRRGIGATLMQHVLKWIDNRGIPSVVLEATAQGEPLYRKLGFVEDYRTVVYAREAGAGSDLDCQLARELVEPMTESDLDKILAFDTPCFGADRHRVLTEGFSRWPNRAFLARDRAGHLAGYVLASDTRIGPWVATDAAAAEALLDAALTLPFTSGPTAALPGLNRVGGSLLLRAGFEPQRSTSHMRRGGTGIVGKPEAIFGRMTLGIG